MTDPRKIPTDIASSEWDKLLDDLGAPEPAESKPPVSQPEEKAAPTSAPSTPRAGASPAFYRPPAKEQKGGPPRPAKPQPPAPPASTPTPVPPPPSAHAAKTVPPPADDDEGEPEERTVVGAIPLDLIADSARGGAAGLQHLLRKPKAEEEGAVDVVLEDEGRQTPPPVDDDAVFTSAPDLSRRRSRADVAQPPLPAIVPPRPPAASKPEAPAKPAPPPIPRPPVAAKPEPPPAPPPPPTHAADEMKDPFAAHRTAPPPAEPAALADPFAAPPRPAAPSHPAVETPPPDSAPKLLEPEERVYSADDQTRVLETPSFDTTRPEPMSAEEAAGEELEAVGAASVPPPARPRSIEPAPLPVTPSPTWPDERDAVTHLADAQMLDEWTERAAWLEAEARTQEDPTARGRLLLVASELVAMTGDDERADALAKEARELLPTSPLAIRQARARVARERAFDELVAPLDAEAQSGPTPAARVHAAVLAGEIERLVKNDPDAAAKRFDAAAGILASDPRAHVQHVATLLASAEKPEYRVPDAEAVAPIRSALVELAAARGALDPASTAWSPIEAIARGRAALAAGSAGDAIAALVALKEVRDVGAAATWLAAALAAPTSATRARSIELLGELQNGAHPNVARRALASRALEQGNVDAARGALSDAAVFSDAERTAVGALLGGPADAFLPSVSAIAGDEDLAPLASAAFAFFTGGTAAPVAGSDVAKARVALGRALGRDQDGVAEKIATLAEVAPDEPTSRLLRLEDDAANARWEAVGDALSRWSSASEGARDRALAAAIVLESAKKPDEALEAAESALASDPSSEVAARIVVALRPETTEKTLSGLASVVDEPARRSLLLVEAALHAGDDASSYLPLLREAHEASPDLPFAAALGARWARRRASVEDLLAWLRLRRESTDDPSEAAYDLVREAMLLVDGDTEKAVQLLEEASRGRPEDLALRDLVVRFASSEGAERGSVAAQAERAQGGAKARLSLMAALEAEQSGDFETAAKLASAAVEAGGGDLAKLVRDRVDAFGPGAARIAEELMAAARDAKSPTDEREAYERLAWLDEVGRGDVASGLLWHRSILEKDATALPSLRRLEHVLVGEGREDELEPIFGEIAKQASGAEAVAHAAVAARLRERSSTWESTKDLVEIAVTAEAKPGLWALRQLAAHALVSRDDDGSIRAARSLVERTDRAPERATLLLRAAEALARKGDTAAAIDLLRKVIEAVPSHPTVHGTLAEVLEKAGDLRGAAEALEAAGDVSAVEAHQLDLRYRAALFWLEKANDAERGTKALERVADVNILYEDVFPRLQALYTQAGERTKLATLLERRLDSEEDPQKRVELEVGRGRALAEVGDVDAAKRALAAALEASPDHVDALHAFADICGKEGDWEGAEQAMIRLGRLVSDPAQQAEIYAKLGDLYQHRLPNPERAELAYREVLKRQPDSVAAKERLVQIYGEMRDAPKALEIQNGLVAAAANPAEKRMRTIELARVYEDVSGDAKKAEQTLEALRKEHANDPSVLRALAEFHTRHNHLPAVNVLLDRAAADARRALTTGRFETHFFANLATVFELRGNADAAMVAHATVEAIEGRPSDVEGVGIGRAARPDLDDLIAPEIFTGAFRELLRQAGPALDGATTVDLKPLRATPFPPAAAQGASRIQEIASAFGFGDAQLLASPAIGPIVIPVAGPQTALVFGAALVAEPNDAIRDFLAVRALKILQGHVSAFSRTAPIDLWPLTAALLKTLAPSWEPQGVDANKLADFRGRIQRAMTGALRPEAGALALEVIGTIGNRASTLQTAANAWGSRCALLALGSASTALDAIAWASGQPSGPPATGPDRLKWIGRNAEARDVVVFSVSNEHAEARAKARKLRAAKKAGTGPAAGGVGTPWMHCARAWPGLVDLHGAGRAQARPVMTGDVEHRMGSTHSVLYGLVTASPSASFRNWRKFIVSRASICRTRSREMPN